jgi:hypothetical protein
MAPSSAGVQLQRTPGDREVRRPFPDILLFSAPGSSPKLDAPPLKRGSPDIVPKKAVRVPGYKLPNGGVASLQQRQHRNPDARRHVQVYKSQGRGAGAHAGVARGGEAPAHQRAGSLRAQLGVFAKSGICKQAYEEQDRRRTTKGNEAADRRHVPRDRRGPKTVPTGSDRAHHEGAQDTDAHAPNSGSHRPGAHAVHTVRSDDQEMYRAVDRKGIFNARRRRDGQVRLPCLKGCIYKKNLYSLTVAFL